VVNLGFAPLPPGAVRDGEVAEPSTVSTVLRRMWSEHKFATKDVVLGVGNQRVMVRELELPAIPLPQLRTSLPFQVTDMLPVAVDDAILDYYPTGTTTSQQGEMYKGLLVAATKETVLANTRAVERAGLRPVLVDLNAFALARVQVRSGYHQGVVAFVDIGARVTNIAIVADGRPRFVRILPSGGQDVTDAVAGTLDIPQPEAEKLKREVGIGIAAPPQYAAAKEAVADVTSTLVDAIRSTLAFYSSTNPGAPVQQMVLSGGGCFLNGLGQYLSSAARLTVALAQPMSSMSIGRGVDQQLRGPWQASVAIPLGLAMGVAA
jgi:type IV pilus assembly protein PilM